MISLSGYLLDILVKNLTKYELAAVTNARWQPAVTDDAEIAVVGRAVRMGVIVRSGAERNRARWAR
ncbi:hypothetical protein CAL20_10805 [Bordetella genomosp. 4]|uniref:Uncharacterized protein n=1 Tax=Bordetella genomosp. 4 TaxID=463044 RepID=A0A261U507_9BORD|nr:hypothetical protein CAL20_10805 [Bordetella genomosp. 4]